MPLHSLYKGAQWQSCLELGQRAGDRRTADLWVMSAGLGLRPVDAPAPSYSATFASGPDSVGGTAAERRLWWSSLRGWDNGLALADLRNRYDELLVVLGPSYLQVLGPEVAAVADSHTAVMSSDEALGLRIVSSAHLRGALGGSALTLNQRAAARYLELAGRAAIGGEAARSRWQEWSSERRVAVAWDRARLNDTEVRQMIREWAAEGPSTATRLLRRLRDLGYACEQSRFAALYGEEVGRIA